MEKSKQWKLSWVPSRVLACFGCLLMMLCPVVGQQLEGQYRMIGSEVRAAFEPLREVLQTSSAVLYYERKPFAFGVVMSEDGYILTKASELEKREGFTVRVDRTEYREVVLVATAYDWDVALLKVEAEGLVPMEFSGIETVEHGTWVVSNGATSRTRRRVRPGIVSANARAIDGESLVVLGVVLQSKDDHVVIREVAEESGAKEAGVEGGDVVLEAEGKKIKERQELVDMLAGKVPGDTLKIKVKRGEEEMEFDVELRARNKTFDAAPMSRNDAMSGRVSERRTNFERVIQHDTMQSERSVGGPLLNLDGQAVGMNIAYANRSEAFAIPAAEVQEIFVELLEKEEE